MNIIYRLEMNLVFDFQIKYKDRARVLQSAYLRILVYLLLQILVYGS